MARFIAAAAAATLLILFAAAATSAQPITVTVAQPPAWTRNKTEWRSRLYNSLRLTPAQVGALETVLDARDALRAPLKNASWTLARAAATAERAKPRNATLEQALVKPLLSLENSTVVAVTRAKENALNATEIKLRAAATAVAHVASTVSCDHQPANGHETLPAPASTASRTRSAAANSSPTSPTITAITRPATVTAGTS